MKKAKLFSHPGRRQISVLVASLGGHKKIVPLSLLQDSLGKVISTFLSSLPKED